MGEPDGECVNNDVLIGEYGRVIRQLISSSQSSVVNTAVDTFVVQMLSAVVSLSVQELSLLIGQEEVGYLTFGILGALKSKCMGDGFRARIIVEESVDRSRFFGIPGVEVKWLPRGFKLASELLHFALSDQKTLLLFERSSKKKACLFPAKRIGITDSAQELFEGLWNAVAMGDNEDVEGSK